MASQSDGDNMMPNLELQAITQHMERMMRAMEERMNERMDRMKQQIHPPPQRENRPQQAAQRQNAPPQGPLALLREQERGGNEVVDEIERPAQNREPRRAEGQNNIKVKIPPFQGKNDPEAFLEWVTRMEMMFQHQYYPEHKKVKLAALEFSNYAAVWWDQLVLNRRRNGEYPVETWEHMKTIMHKRYVPNSYYRILHQKLQELTQGNRSVKEYYKELELALIRANIKEDYEATMVRFLQGLRPEIADIVEMQQYEDLEELVHQASKVEERLKRRRSPQRYNYEESNAWRIPLEREEPNPPQVNPNISTSSTSVPNKLPELHKTEGNIPITSEIKYFQCQNLGQIDNKCENKKTLVINTPGEIKSENKSCNIEKNKLENLEIKNNKNDFHNEHENEEEGTAIVIKKKENSELESSLVSYQLLKVPLCKEIPSYSNPWAGFVPSNESSVLQIQGGNIQRKVSYDMLPSVIKQQEPWLQGYDLLSSLGQKLIVFNHNMHVKEHICDFYSVFIAFETIKFNRCYWNDNVLKCWKNNFFVPKCSLYELNEREACKWNLLDRFKTTTLKILHNKHFCLNNLFVHTCSFKNLFHEDVPKLQIAGKSCEHIPFICILVFKSDYVFILILGMYEWLFLLSSINNTLSILIGLISHSLMNEYTLIDSIGLAKHEIHFEFILDVFKLDKLFANPIECNTSTTSISFLGFDYLGKEINMTANQEEIMKKVAHKTSTSQNRFAFDPGGAKYK